MGKKQALLAHLRLSYAIFCPFTTLEGEGGGEKRKKKGIIIGKRGGGKRPSDNPWEATTLVNGLLPSLRLEGRGGGKKKRSEKKKRERRERFELARFQDPSVITKSLGAPGIKGGKRGKGKKKEI